jgi:hypothetical protein
VCASATDREVSQRTQQPARTRRCAGQTRGRRFSPPPATGSAQPAPTALASKAARPHLLGRAVPRQSLSCATTAPSRRRRVPCLEAPPSHHES